MIESRKSATGTVAGIPDMNIFKPLSIGSKSVFTEYLRRYPPKISELTFTNLFIWNHYYNIHYTVEDNLLFIVSFASKSGGDVGELRPSFILPPVGNIERFMELYTDLFLSGNIFIPIHRAERKIVPEILKLMPDGVVYSVKPLRNHFDYVYNTEELIRLAGKKYFNIRKKVNKFKRSHNWRFGFIGEDYTVEDCKEFLKRWCSIRDCKANPPLLEEVKAVETLLDFYDFLDVRGIVLEVDGEIVGFAIGEPLNPETYVCHIEKADPTVFGAYQMVCKIFAENVAKDYPLLNREQDMGVESLKTAKMRLHPVFFIEKYDIVPAPV